MVFLDEIDLTAIPFDHKAEDCRFFWHAMSQRDRALWRAEMLRRTNDKVGLKLI
jgi:hypothetical protein